MDRILSFKESVVTQLEKVFDQMNMPPNAQGQSQGQGQEPGGQADQAGPSQVPPGGEAGSSSATNTSYQAGVRYTPGSGYTSMADVASPHPTTLQGSNASSTVGQGPQPGVATQPVSQGPQPTQADQQIAGPQSQGGAQGLPQTGHVRQTVAAINQGQAGPGQQQAAGGYGQPQQPGVAAGGQSGQAASRDQQQPRGGAGQQGQIVPGQQQQTTGEQPPAAGGFRQNVPQQNQPYLGPASARPAQQQSYVPLSVRNPQPASGSQVAGYGSEPQQMKNPAQDQRLPQEQYSYPPSYQASTAGGSSRMTVGQAQQGYYGGGSATEPPQVSAAPQITAAPETSLSDTEWLKSFRKVCSLDAVQFADIWTLYDSDGKSNCFSFQSGILPDFDLRPLWGS